MPILTQLKNMNVEGVCAALDQCGDNLKLSPFLDVNFVTRNGTTDFGEHARYKGFAIL